MKQIKVGNLELSDGHPKVCVPIVGENHDEVIEQAKKSCGDESGYNRMEM